MGFLAEMKNEICETAPKSPCCKRSVLFGMLAARGTADESETVTLRLTDAAAAELAVRLIAEQFGRQAERLPQRHGGRVHEIAFNSHSASRFIGELETRFLGGAMPKQCPQCAFSFLKGVFLAAGHIVDPEKAYHLELSLGERAEPFMAFLEREYGLMPKLARRRNESLLYFKESGVLEDIMTMLGITEAVFKLANTKIEKQFRNAANRRANCEASNISRAVDAASRVVTVIGKMKEEKLLSSLPDELEEAACMRYDNPEASLTQLAAMMSPPLTKSGLNHRLQKIMDYARRMGIDPDKL